MTGDVKAADKVRATERADYEATHQDYTESISALERAIEVLKKQDYDRPHASFAQIAALQKMTLIPPDAKKAIDMFLAQDQEEQLADSAPEANAYEFKSKGIIDMLQKLLDKFVDERTTLEKEETSARHAYEMLMADLNAQVEQATSSRDEKAE